MNMKKVQRKYGLSNRKKIAEHAIISTHSFFSVVTYSTSPSYSAILCILNFTCTSSLLNFKIEL